MSAIKEAIAAMKDLILLSDKIDKTGKLMTEISKELREHDNRLVRLETMVEIAKLQKLPKK